ncbi:alpha/beta hydrolase [Bacteroides sp. 51]|uniref:alpha/beta hydrolase n=1 Tax=Bacteroides sp. 51 TaxID=2302938 RepID=UPI0013D7955F|nr:alpha/beta hydrolase [Bacteroides sp. 51]NDV81245.1 alpha/beta hydrolase [Bacteroides sp. 51]
MKRIVLLLLISAIVVLPLMAQEFVPIWEGGAMPNSKGVALKDSIANERVYQVGTPGMYVFQPSEAENKGAAVLIIPGGGYVRLAYQISGWQLAKWFNTFGVTAFVLNHRFPQSPDVKVSHKAPLEDAQRAMRYIRSHARKYGIQADRVGVMGSSAGGHLSACLSTITEDWGRGGDGLDIYPFKPNFTLLISPVVSMREYAHKGSRENLLGKEPTEELLHLFSCDEQVGNDTPPAFMVHATDDRSVSSMNSVLYYSALKKNGVAGSAMHIYPAGGHSISLRDNPGTTMSWSDLAEGWLREIGILE